MGYLRVLVVLSALLTGCGSPNFPPVYFSWSDAGDGGPDLALPIVPEKGGR